MARRKQPVIPDALVDQLLAGADAKTAFDKDGLLDELKKALAERALNAEMDHHLGAGKGDGNRRNGYGRKTVLTGGVDPRPMPDNLVTPRHQATQTLGRRIRYQISGRKSAARNNASTPASILSVLICACAIALTCRGLATITRAT
jgi:mutator family transposase